MFDDFTYIIQGRLCSDTAKSIYYAKQFFNKIIVSAWDHKEDYGYVCDIEQFNIQLILNNPLCFHDPNFGSLYPQTVSTLSGLLNVQTKFVIKSRTDEYFENKLPFIGKILKDESKIVCGNIFFRKDEFHKLCVGDHIIGGATNNVRTLFASTLNTLDNKFNHIDKFNGNPTFEYKPTMYYCEPTIAYSYINYFEKRLSFQDFLQNSKFYIKKYFDLVSYKDFGIFKFRYNGINKEFTNENVDSPQLIDDHFNNVIHDINEL